ncbi:MAG: argininosuccinate lyase, partial [Chloroflexota bacterium]
KMRAALDDAMLATDLADYLVKKGMPFRQAHHAAGEVVALAEQKGIPLAVLELNDLRRISELFTDNVYDVFNFDAAVAQRRAAGGTAPDAVREQIAQARALLEK